MVLDYQLKRKGQEQKKLESKNEIREANSRYEKSRFQRVPGRFEKRPFSASVPGVVIPSVSLWNSTWMVPPNRIWLRHRVTNIELPQLHNAGPWILGRDGRRAHGEQEGKE
jgi:hypothetical protein